MIVETREVFICEYCGAKFFSCEGCEHHEKWRHDIDYAGKSKREIADGIRGLYCDMDLWRTGNQIMGRPFRSVKSLLKEAASRLCDYNGDYDDDEGLCDYNNDEGDEEDGKMD